GRHSWYWSQPPSSGAIGLRPRRKSRPRKERFQNRRKPFRVFNSSLAGRYGAGITGRRHFAEDRSVRMFSVIFGLFLAISASATRGAEQSEAEYAKALEGRAADALGAIRLGDPAKEGRVHDAIVARYRELREWHEVNDGKIKELGKSLGDPAKAQLAGI